MFKYYSIKIKVDVLSESPHTVYSVHRLYTYLLYNIAVYYL